MSAEAQQPAGEAASVPVPPVQQNGSGAQEEHAPAAGDAAAAAAAAPAASAAAPAPADGSAAASEDASRKRRSRWGGTAAAAAAPAGGAPSVDGSAAAPAGDLDENGQPRKRSRWSKAPPVADAAASVLAALTPEQIESFKIQLRVDELTRMLQNPAEALRQDEMAREASGRRSRTPSPEPLYDSNGQRTNTRPIRFAIKLEKERQTLVETLQKLNPNYRPPVGFRKIRYERRLLIPIKEYPDYNFIGMIIGPRGLTQKRMEKESGCRIVIRGRGSQKEGRAHMKQPGDDDDLHVLISGDDESRVIATTREVEKLLVPIDESKNEHKARQLRELAVINGTLRDEIICRLCGQPGHKQLECSQRNQSWRPANIRCQICNSELHPSADCPQRFHRTAEQAAREVDNEYAEFMNEISGDGPVATRSAQPLYITDGGAQQHGGGGGGGGGGSSVPLAERPGVSNGGPSGPPPQGGGYERGGGGGGGYHSGSRMVKGNDPRENFREFRPANAAALAASAALPAISARGGFDNVHATQYSQPPHQHGGYGGGGGGYGHGGGGGGGYGNYPSQGGGGGYGAPWPRPGGGGGHPPPHGHGGWQQQPPPPGWGGGGPPPRGYGGPPPPPPSGQWGPPPPPPLY